MRHELTRYALTSVFAPFFTGSSFIASKTLLRDFAPFYWQLVGGALVGLSIYGMNTRPARLKPDLII